MQVVTTVGLDIAKSVFQVHGVDGAGQVVIRRQLKRRYVRHSREAASVSGGHRGLCIIASDAASLREKRFVATKTPEQQSGLTLHRTRYLFIRHSAYPQERTIPAHRSHEASKRLDAIPGL